MRTHCHDCDCASEQLEEATAVKEGEVSLRRKAEEGYLEIKEKVNTSTTNAKRVLMYLHTRIALQKQAF